MGFRIKARSLANFDSTPAKLRSNTEHGENNPDYAGHAVFKCFSFFIGIFERDPRNEALALNFFNARIR